MSNHLYFLIFHLVVYFPTCLCFKLESEKLKVTETMNGSWFDLREVPAPQVEHHQVKNLLIYLKSTGATFIKYRFIL